MKVKVFIAGHGGQGVLFAGVILASAAMAEGKNVTWLPSYGSEMRGGTANCSVIISDEEIASPVVTRPDVLIAYNEPSLRRFLDTVAPSGLVLYDSAMVSYQPVAPAGMRCLPVPATAVATGLGEPRVANLVVLGALIGHTGIIAARSAEEALKTRLRSETLLEKNIQALKAGMDLAHEFGGVTNCRS